MKKLSRTLLTSINWLLGVLLVLLGYACSNDNPVCEYGTPHAKYTIKGKVTNQSGNPIPGIEIKMSSYINNCPEILDDPRYPYKSTTDSVGRYSVDIETFPREKLTLFATDIDGSVNGSFQADTITINSNNIELSGGKSWYEGEGSITVDLVLQEEILEEDTFDNKEN